jgi:hypothetical protein
MRDVMKGTTRDATVREGTRDAVKEGRDKDVTREVRRRGAR